MSLYLEKILLGKKHPLTVLDEIKKFSSGWDFPLLRPEIETDEYNFERLNL